MEEKEWIVEELESRTCGAATDLAIAAGGEKPDITLPSKYQDFASVVSKQEAE